MEPRRFGRYEIIGELGKGAMGVVYRARDPMLNRTVAIKTINMALELDEMAEYEARFHQEARAAGGLNHPNIVTIYDIGKSGSMAYMAMEFLEGRELRALLVPGTPLPVAHAVDIAAQVAEGLAYAHQHEVVHRDVKPANIMIVREGLAKITDFGIARMRSTEVRTQTGVVLGSPKYMSPEQVLGKRAEPRSDIFSLGVILYEMLTGKAPFAGADVNSMMFQTLNLVPPAPGTLNPAVPEMLDLIVAKALAKAPDDRYASAAEFAADLHACKKLAAAAAAQTPVPAAAPAHARADPDATAPLLARSYPGTRREDGTEDAAQPESATALGLAKGFDSLEATLRLAARTGMTHEMTGYAQTQQPAAATTVRGTVVGMATLNRGAPRLDVAPPPWGRRDRLIFWGSIAAAAGAAIAIVLL